MSERAGDEEVAAKVGRRAAEIYRELLATGYRNVDRLLAALLVLEWARPRSWRWWTRRWPGTAKPRAHPHVWAALVLCGLTVSLPSALALLRPGRASTRQCVAVGADARSGPC